MQVFDECFMHCVGLCLLKRMHPRPAVIEGRLGFALVINCRSPPKVHSVTASRIRRIEVHSTSADGMLCIRVTLVSKWVTVGRIGSSFLVISLSIWTDRLETT